MKPDITMFADASLNPNTKTSGWGFWIKGDGRESLSAGGPLRNFHSNSCVAELEAIANGLDCASASGYFRPSDVTIMIQSDSLEALGCLLQARPSIVNSKHEAGASVTVRRRRMNDRHEAAVRHILKIIDRHGLSAAIRHVRGHKGGGGRNWVNRLCDSLANKGRKAAERERRNATQKVTG